MPKNKSVSHPISDHCNGTHFFNPGLHIKKSMKHVFKMLQESKGKNKWPDFIENQATPQLAPELPVDQVYITYVNHASHLIQLQNMNILTDPIFSKRAGPFSLLGPKRVRRPGIELKKLPNIDVVLVSHNHYDHMDLPSLNKLEQMFHPLFLVPLGNQRYFKAKRIIELDWWQTHLISNEQAVTLVPAQHWSKRTLSDANKALWGGFWIQFGSIKIYFAGDSAYGPHFKLIHEKLGAPNISILPIGAYEPRWFMKDSHMNPEEAVLASFDLKSQFSVATHHQTFRLTLEKIDDPVNDLKHSMVKHGVKEANFLAPETGETVIYNHTKQQMLERSI